MGSPPCRTGLSRQSTTKYKHTRNISRILLADIFGEDVKEETVTAVAGFIRTCLDEAAAEPESDAYRLNEVSALCWVQLQADVEALLSN